MEWTEGCWASQATFVQWPKHMTASALSVGGSCRMAPENLCRRRLSFGSQRAPLQPGQERGAALGGIEPPIARVATE